MKVSQKKSLRVLGVAAGVSALLAGAFIAGRMVPFDRASAGGKDFEVIDRAAPPPLSSPLARQSGPLAGPDPFQSFKQMEQEMDELVNRAFTNFGSGAGITLPFGGLGSVPDMDLREEGNGYVIRLDMPGIETGSINVKVEENQLTISGTRTEDAEQNAGSMLRKERHVGSFTRSMSLPQAVDPDSLKTDYEDGVLTVHIQKRS